MRTDAEVEYKVYPRLLALAERAWHEASWELPLKEGQEFSASTNAVDRQALGDDWSGFAAALGNKELRKLDLGGVGYRVPVPGAVVKDNRVRVALPYPGLPLEYFDGKGWQPLEEQTPAEAVRTLRARSADGERAGRAVPLDPPQAETAQR